MKLLALTLLAAAASAAPAAEPHHGGPHYQVAPVGPYYAHGFPYNQQPVVINPYAQAALAAGQPLVYHVLPQVQEGELEEEPMEEDVLALEKEEEDEDEDLNAIQYYQPYQQLQTAAAAYPTAYYRYRRGAEPITPGLFLGALLQAAASNNRNNNYYNDNYYYDDYDYRRNRRRNRRKNRRRFNNGFGGGGFGGGRRRNGGQTIVLTLG